MTLGHGKENQKDIGRYLCNFGVLCENDIKNLPYILMLWKKWLTFKGLGIRVFLAVVSSLIASVLHMVFIRWHCLFLFEKNTFTKEDRNTIQNSQHLKQAFHPRILIPSPLFQSYPSLSLNIIKSLIIMCSHDGSYCSSFHGVLQNTGLSLSPLK